ncbi:MAG: bacterioferritin [Chloroflexi bacterium]|nr:bacterioferritin [Chloroflexota bacterium]
MVQTQKPQIVWSERLRNLTDRARENLVDGALTDAYKANREEVIGILNRALASEWSAFLQYWHHYFMASDLHSSALREMFKKQAAEEMEHARAIGERVQLLGGVPCTRPEDISSLTPTPVQYGHDLRSMLEADLIGERATIMFYCEVVRHCGNDDIVTRRMFEDLLEDEEEHADELLRLLYQFDATTSEQIPSLHEAPKGVAEAGVRRPEVMRAAGGRR